MSRSLRHASRSRSAIFAPIGDSGRAVRVEQRLADAIRSGLLADGERLPSEQELASMLGVATVTAREALVALRSQGLVTTVRGRGGGSFVTRPKQIDDSSLSDRLSRMTRVELRDRGTLYRVILAGCAELAAQYADDQDADSLRDLLVPEDEPDVAVWRHAGSELYLSVAALTQSARMTREVVRHEADFGVLLRLPLSSVDFRCATRKHHVALVDAIALRAADAARRAVHDQVDEALGHLVDLHRAVR
ncbi:MAG TPA: GntR family transcriptional regulator [Nocardioidaceae bacterium]|nr:GntR family transcriptional regulator [Nocardioidaceae bacterium]